MRKPNLTALFLTLLVSAAHAQTSGYRTPPDHPIGYLYSLPKGWQPAHSYPVLVAIPGAERDFKKTLDTFTAVGSPFIILVPFVTTNGGPGYRDAPEYKYTQPTWDRIAQDRWKFDEEGIAAAVRDVHQAFGGETKVFLTGFEAGGHTVWAMAFNHPEHLRAAAPVAANYAARYVAFSSSPARGTLPIQAFVGSKDDMLKPNVLIAQWKRAQADANANGFHATLTEVPGKGHVWLAKEVTDWFKSLLPR